MRFGDRAREDRPILLLKPQPERQNDRHARSFAINILHKNGTTNVAQALWNGALSLDNILAYKAI